jgi:hypothetical protein
MSRIISVATLVLGLALGSQGLRAQDEAVTTEVEAAPAAETGTAPIVLQDNVPARYTVVKGDTLWGISGRFLKNPWKWPDVWGVNKDEIRNPHLIYPGDVIILDLTGNTPRLRLEGMADGGASRWYGWELQSSRLSPQMRGSPINALPIPTISARSIEPFLVRPLVVDPSQVARAPVIVANTDKRVVVSAGDTAYVTGLDAQKGPRWQVYRVSTIQIARAHQEIATGDRLALAPPMQNSAYIPRAPERSIRGRVIAGADNSVVEMGTFAVIIMNRGARDGLEVGHVLGLYRSEGAIPLGDSRLVQLPEQRYGLALVFRVFEKMSYGLVMTSRRPVNVMDTISNP